MQRPSSSGSNLQNTKAGISYVEKEQGTAWLSEVSAVILQQALRHLDTAYQNLFEKRAEYPTFKKKHGTQSATYTDNAFTLKDGCLTLAKQKEPLQIVWSRPLPEGAKPSSVTVSKDKAGRYFVSILVEEDILPLEAVEQCVGVDVGLKSFAVLSTGERKEVFIIMYNDPNSQPPYGQPQQPYTSPYEQQYTQQPVPPYPSTQYGAPPMQPVPPPFYVVQQPKQSSKTIWIVLGIILAIILLVGGGCCAAISFGVLKGSQAVNSAVQSLNATATVDEQTAIADEPSPQSQAEDYYTAIESQDYSYAYDDLSSNFKLADGTTLTVTQFTQKAEALDSSEGVVTDFTATPDSSSQTKVDVQVTRQSGKTYTAHLTFVQGDFEWDISSFDTI